MHPDLWTIPGVGYTIRAYGLCMLIGFALAVWIAVARAKRVKADPSAITTASIIGLAVGIIGCRGMHLLHYFGPQLRSGEMGARDVVAMSGGGEIMGGVLLAIASVVLYLALRRKSIRLYLDILVAPMILAMGIGRIGCLMFGCCWGQTCVTEGGDSALAWGVRFPYGSPAYMRHWEEEKLSVPGELMWRSPVNKELSPFPRVLLFDPALEDPVAARFAETASTVRELRQADPQGEELGRKQDELIGLQQALPGGTRIKQKAYAAAAIHLHQLAGRQGTDLPAALAHLRELAAKQHSLWVHPTQIYDAIGLTIMFVVLSIIFHRRKRHGMVIAWTMILYAASRYLQEMLRADNPHDVGGFTISQFLSLAVLLLGVIYLVLLLKVLPEKSPRAPQTAPEPVEPSPSPA